MSEGSKRQRGIPAAALDRGRDAVTVFRMVVARPRPVNGITLAGGDNLRDLEAILAHVRVTPPTCIADAAPQLEPDDALRDDEAFATSFRIGCSCGWRSTVILCFPTKIQRDIVILSPLALQCPECSKVTEFFDSDRHGYDPEVCGDSATMRGSGERQQFACKRCGHRSGQAIVTFAFNNASEILGDLPEALEGREQDAFDWFTLEFACGACATREVVTDFERA